MTAHGIFCLFKATSTDFKRRFVLLVDSFYNAKISNVSKKEQ